MNALAAIKGYAEMLQEDLAGEPVSLFDALTRLLSVVQTASSDEHGAAEEAPRLVASEPGFILAVDDQQENRELAARYLSRNGHMVITAASGEEALRTLAQTDVDVVLLDLVMPGMDGREVLRKIKEHPDWRATPVIVISGRQDMTGIIDCIESGADDYLFKPFNPVLLGARIKAGIERKRWHDREQDYRQQLERKEKFIRATFGRYLTDDIVTEILERPEGLELGGDLREVTIMMSDIRGFTTISEHLAPADVVRMLNRYLGRMTDIIMAHQGTIDEFIGDAILAVFGAPQRGDDDADRAVSCALEMQQAMEEINRANLAEGLPQISTGIALNTGAVIAGNIGSERRSKYGFVGHPMNVTARIEDVTAGNELLISDSTLRKLAGNYRIGSCREIKVKGIDQAVVIHQVLGKADG
jgi:class 3 adenylate cyclase